MPKPAPGSLPDGKFEAWNKGYGDGYARNQALADQAVATADWVATYMRAFIAGFEDRLEDEEAMQLGEFDLLNEDERRAIYGDEHDRV